MRALLFAALACASASSAGAPAPVPAPDASALLAGLSLEQKVGQLMMVGFSGPFVDDEVRARLTGLHVGGVCLFKHNILGAAEVAALNAAIAAAMAAELPPFIAVDQEGGRVVRVEGGGLVLPGNMALGAARHEALAYEAGKRQGEALRLLGFTMNLAPVLDVNLNPRNPVIGLRAFADDPALVARLGRAFVRGQQEADVVTVAKHFPGHGNTDADSHKALPVMQETQAQLLAQAGPFTQAIRGGLDGLMTAHVALPKVTGDDLPATLSPKLLQGLLRGRLGFDGLVLTDELEMEAIAGRYGVGKAAVMAVLAGADMVLVPWRPEKQQEAHAALLAAARSGELPLARLDEAVRRVVVAKLRRKLFSPTPPVAQRLAELGAEDRQQLAREIARQSVTLLRAEAGVFPLRAGQRVGVLTAEPALAEAVLRRQPGAKVLTVTAEGVTAAARAVVEGSDVVVVGLLDAQQKALVRLAAAAGKPVVAVSLGLPYVAERLPNAKTVLAVYSYRAVSAEAAVAALFGEQGTPGRLPVSLTRFPFGYGLNPVGEARAAAR